MEEKKKQVLNKWLEIDMINIAKKMGMSGKSCDVNSELLMDTIRCLDYESILVEKPMLTTYECSTTRYSGGALFICKIRYA